jgi:hypothetical protein
MHAYGILHNNTFRDTKYECLSPLHFYYFVLSLPTHLLLIQDEPIRACMHACIPANPSSNLPSSTKHNTHPVLVYSLSPKELFCLQTNGIYKGRKRKDSHGRMTSTVNRHTHIHIHLVIHQ